MEYFRIRQDKRYIHPPYINNIRDIIRRRQDISLSNASRIEDVSVGFSEIRGSVDFIDILDQQVFLISNEVRNVFTMYEPYMILKEICIINSCTDEYGRYFIPLLPEVDCLSDKSVVSPDKSYVKRLVLKKRFDSQVVFKVAGLLTDAVMIRLDAVESLLRRGTTKFTLEPIEVMD